MSADVEEGEDNGCGGKKFAMRYFSSRAEEYFWRNGRKVYWYEDSQLVVL